VWNTATIKQDKAWEEAERCSHEKSDLYMLQFLEYNLIFIYILEVEKQIFKMYVKNRNFEKKQKETLMLRKISNEKFNNKLDTAELKISEQDYR
jgi:hypothetical protein